MAKKETKSIGVTPLADRILIKPIVNNDKEKKSAAGIIIPVQLEDDKIDRGEVLAVGEGRIDSKGDVVAPRVKVGNKVLFQWGDKVLLNGEEYFLVSESSILAVIK